MFPNYVGLAETPKDLFSSWNFVDKYFNILGLSL